MIFLDLARKSQWAVFHQHRENYNYSFSGSVCGTWTVPEHGIFSAESSPKALALWMSCDRDGSGR